MSTADEVRADSPLPLWEVPGWRERFGVVAGITGRGDDPAHPFDLGLSSRAPIIEVLGRWRQLRDELRFVGQVAGYQVHGDRVAWHEGSGPASWTVLDATDGHATRTPGRLLHVTAADCVPVYLIAPRYRAIALVHAGWRGTAAGIVGRALQVLREAAGAPASDIVMHAGIGICGSCYEVGSEVVEALRQPVTGSGPWHVDLRDVLLQQARSLGVGEMTASGLCTACHRDHFFSHRGSRGSDGRMLAYLGMPA
ncbi:MAG: polyphenol oxidase family protein [Gemmatimonadales bacterium]